MLDRRRFVSLAALASATPLLGSPRSAFAQDASPTLVIRPEAVLGHIPADFTGLSYESSQLTHPSFFSAANTSLIQFFKTLGDTGVLRLGGNMSEFTTWSNTDLPEVADDGGVEGPDPGKGTTRVFTLSPHSIVKLNEFLIATNWKLIYGLNLARGTAQAAADEAACVMRICGPRVLALQFGNEPDLFKQNPSATPTDGHVVRWTYAQFITKWNEFEKAVRARVPNAPLAGPDTSFRPEWVGKFAEDTKGRTFLLTAHYYAEGPPTNPDMTLNRLLTDKTKFASNMEQGAALARAAGMPYRMSEGNSCYSAGKKGVSDTFGSALWSGDFCAHVAALGATGVNLHGGGNGLYTPIAGSTQEGFLARPDYYGMLLAKPLQGASLLTSELDDRGQNVTAYAVEKQDRITVMAFNKSDRSTTLALVLPAARARSHAEVIRLTAPSVEATGGVLLGGSAVGSDGKWSPSRKETLAPAGGRYLLSLPPYSAASVHLA